MCNEEVHLQTMALTSSQKDEQSKHDVVFKFESLTLCRMAGVFSSFSTAKSREYG